MISILNLGQEISSCLLVIVSRDIIRMFQSCSASGSTMIKTVDILIFAVGIILNIERSCEVESVI